MTAPLSKERIAELHRMGPSNVWWTLDSGDHLNIMEELLDAYEALQAERDSLLEAKRVLEYNCDLRQGRAELAEAERDRYREALQYALDYSNDPGVIAEVRRALSGTDDGGGT